MAKHLSELRAFPLFLYGQQYMLGVEAWLAAPLFALAGPSATALTLPRLAINVGIAVASESPQRILIYNDIVAAHAGGRPYGSRAVHAKGGTR